MKAMRIAGSLYVGRAGGVIRYATSPTRALAAAIVAAIAACGRGKAKAGRAS